MDLNVRLVCMVEVQTGNFVSAMFVIAGLLS
jgi:hypothetical protein